MGVYACYDRICINHHLDDGMSHCYFGSASLLYSAVRSYLFNWFQRFYFLLKALRIWLPLPERRSMLVLLT